MGTKRFVCLPGEMGESCYVTTMAVKDLVAVVSSTIDIETFEMLDMSQIFQREPEIKRVIKEVVPYILNNESWFFNNLLVDIYTHLNEVDVTPIYKWLDDDMPYKNDMKDVMILSIPDNADLVALDGQHRLLALRIALLGAAGIPIKYRNTVSMLNMKKGLKPHPEFGEKRIPVTFTMLDSYKKRRQLFTAINTTAKKTSTSENTTMGDDMISVITRDLLFRDDSVLMTNDQQPIVYTGKAYMVSLDTKHFIALSPLRNITKILLNKILNGDLMKYDIDFDGQYQLGYEIVSNFWKQMYENIPEINEAINLSRKGEPLKKLKVDSYLMYASVQKILAYVAYETRILPWSEISAKIGKMDWSFLNNEWKGILINADNTKLKTSVSEMKFAAEYIINKLKLKIN